MDCEAWLRRLDAHMERDEKIMRRSDETMRRSNELAERFEGREDDLKVFIRDEGTRRDRVVDQLLKRSDERWREMGAQIRANTEATWALIDRFNGKGSA